MEQEANPVRKVQQHLRRAATFVSERDFDAAAREVDAVLTLDPASLPAQAMKERIAAARSRVAPLPRVVSAPHVPEPRPSDARFVPSGIDAQSWMGFEARIQERRYRALTETITTAIANGDGLAARVALEEARELRPDAAELDALSTRVALLPVSVAAAEMSASLWSRAFGGVALLLVGVAFLVGIDWLRPAAQRAVQAPVTTAVTTPAPQPVSSPDLQVAAPLGSVAAASASTPTVPEPQPVGTIGENGVGTHFPATAEESGRADAPRSTFQTTAANDESVPSSGEVPDDYVAAQPRRENRVVVATPARAPAPAPVVTPPSVDASPAAPYASVIRQPTPIVTSSLVSPANAAATAAVPTRVDQDQVQQTLRRYARAYRRNTCWTCASSARVDTPAVAAAVAVAGATSDDVTIGVG